MSSVQKNVAEMIASDKIVIFSKTYCPYCKLVKSIFSLLKQGYTAIELDQRADGESIQNYFMQVTGVRTVPRVFLRGRLLGGSTDIKDLHQSGRLTYLLESDTDIALGYPRDLTLKYL